MPRSAPSSTSDAPAGAATIDRRRRRWVCGIAAVEVCALLASWLAWTGETPTARAIAVPPAASGHAIASAIVTARGARSLS